MTIWHMRIACCIPRATNTHYEYVVFIAFYASYVCTNATQCNVIRSLRVVFLLERVHNGSKAGRGVKRPGREPDHSPPYSAEIKYEWIYTSTPPIRLHDVDRDNFTF
jgi:hypothetical protein